MGSVKISQTAQCPCDQDIVLSGKILLITSNLPSLCMHSIIWHESYIARTSMVHFILCYKISRSKTSIPLMSHMTRFRFPMAFQWYALICVKSTCGKVFSYLSTILPFLQAIYWSNAAMSNIIQMAILDFRIFSVVLLPIP